MTTEGPAARAQSAASDADAAAVHLGEIAVLNRDLMFGVRIGNQLRSLGYTVGFAPDTVRFVNAVRNADPAPVLGIVDMNAGVDWPAIAALTGDPAITMPILVFGPHLDVGGRRAAKAAGVARLVSNGDFHREMVTLVRRYARAPRAG